MKPHTAAAILGIIDAHGMPKNKDSAEPVIRAWLRAHDAQVDRWGNYHLSSGKRVKFSDRVVRIEEKDKYGWRLRDSFTYVEMALNLAQRAADAGGRQDLLQRAQKRKAVRKAASDRNAVKRKEAYELSNGPGYYVTNGYTGHSLKMRHADHDKPFASLDAAIEMAKKKYDELTGMKFTYLLPVQVVKAPDRLHAETPVAGVIGKGGVEVFWEDGRRVAPPPDPNQQRLPGMSAGSHPLQPGQAVEVNQIWASGGTTGEHSRAWIGGYEYVGMRKVRSQIFTVVRHTRGHLKGEQALVWPMDVRAERPKGRCCGMSKGKKADPMELIRLGDMVTIRIYVGMGRHGVEWKEKTGRAVMRGDHGWVLNMGGKHGTPAVVTEENFVRVHRLRSES